MTHYSMRDYSPSTSVLLKARRYLAKGAVKAASGAYPPVFYVQGSAPAPYRVQTDARRKKGGRTVVTWLTCTCNWGLKQGAGASACSHAVAALLALRDDMDLPEIERPATLSLTFEEPR